MTRRGLSWRLSRPTESAGRSKRSKVWLLIVIASSNSWESRLKKVQKPRKPKDWLTPTTPWSSMLTTSRLRWLPMMPSSRISMTTRRRLRPKPNGSKREMSTQRSWTTSRHSEFWRCHTSFRRSSSLTCVSVSAYASLTRTNSAGRKLSPSLSIGCHFRWPSTKSGVRKRVNISHTTGSTIVKRSFRSLPRRKLMPTT